MTVSRGTAAYQMIGDSRLGVNFGSRQMDGKITNIQGRRGNGKTFSAAGQIDYDTGNFPSGRSVFGVDYSGLLTVGTDRIAIDGRAIGGFFGNPDGGGTSAVQAIDGTPGTDAARSIGVSNMTTRLNGEAASGQIRIIGQN